MILHHFLVPGFMNAAWWNLFKGNIKTASGLTKFLLQKRKDMDLMNIGKNIIDEYMEEEYKINF
jgi:hypothetical protein